MSLLSGVSADQTMPCRKALQRPIAAEWRYIQAFQMIVPEIIIASALLSNAQQIGL